MSTTAIATTARCVHCAWKTDVTEPDALKEQRDLHELIHPGGTALVGPEPPATSGHKARSGNEPWTPDEAIAAIKAFVADHHRPPASDEWKSANGLPSYPTAAKLFGGVKEAIAAADGRAVPPPVAPAKQGQSSGRKQSAKEQKPASQQGSQETAEGTLVELAKAVDELRARRREILETLATCSRELADAVGALSAALEDVEQESTGE